MVNGTGVPFLALLHGYSTAFFVLKEPYEKTDLLPKRINAIEWNLFESKAGLGPGARSRAEQHIRKFVEAY